MPDFRMQPSFPIASVIDAAQRKGQLDNATSLAQSQMLNSSLEAIGKVGQSLLQRRQQMAQALAGAQMYMATPEGKEMLAPTSLADIHTSPLPISQTAQGTDDAGNPLPAPIPNALPSTNASPMAGPVANVREQTTKSIPSGVTPQTFATAFMNESPSNMLTQLFERQKQRQLYGLDVRKQDFSEKMKPIELAQQAALTQALTGVRAGAVSADVEKGLRESIATEEARKLQAAKDFPELADSFISGIFPAGLNEKEKAARDIFSSAQKNIDSYNRKLYGGGSSGGKGKVGVTMTTPNGLSYTVNP